MNESYCKEFKAQVADVLDDRYIILNESCFYPEGGGQPCDLGVILCEENEYEIVHVTKFDGLISHEVSAAGLKVGDNVTGLINWERKYQLMKSHTAGHILSQVINLETAAKITGNQLGVERSRIDFNIETFDRKKIREYEQKTNEIIAQNLDVNISVIPLDEALKMPSVFHLAKTFSKNITEVTIISIGDFDSQACGGTHVKNTSEIGFIEVLKVENKGSNNRRIIYKIK